MPDTQPQTTNPPVTAQSRYEQLKTDRSPYDQRQRDAAIVTIPALFPPEGSNGATQLPTPYQSVGARGMNNLAAKLLLTLFPPGTPFFKLEVAESVMDELKAKSTKEEDVAGRVQAALSKMERAVMKKMESKNTRAVLFEVLKHLLLGNALLVVLPSGSLKFFTLYQYVVKRDLDGNVLEIITKESLSRRTLPKEARAIVERSPAPEAGTDPQKSLDLYTWVTRKDNGSWRVHQEIVGTRIPGTEGSYPADKLAWLPLRWTAVPGEDYGRGFIEEYQGDLNSLESLSQSLVDFSAAASKHIFFVDEAGVTSKATIQNAPNLAVVDGNAKDVTILKVEKVADFKVTKEQSDEIKLRLEQAFLLTSSIQRNAERVTAEEVRTMAAELEQALGGVYSILAQELQRPLVVRFMFLMQRAGELEHLPEKSVSPQIVTGIEGLGRQSDFGKLQVLLAGVQQAFGPEAVSEYSSAGWYLTRGAAALGLDIDGFVRSEEQVQEERARRMQAALAEKLGPPAIKANADRDTTAMQAAQPAAQPQQTQ